MIGAAVDCPAEQSVLEIDHVGVSFGGVRALHDVTISIREDALTAIIGPNGAGKTTLFNVICGYVPTATGRVLFQGCDISNAAAWKRARLGIARTFQRVEIPETLLGWEAVAFGAVTRARATLLGEALRTRRARREEELFRHRAQEIGSLLDLEPWLDAPVGTMPLGIRRRVELGRALALRPKVVLLDEVASGVDALETRQLVEVIRSLRSSQHVGFIMVEHDMAFVLELAEEVFVLDRGQLLARGDPNTIVRDPEVQRAYLGSRDAEDREAAKHESGPFGAWTVKNAE